MTRIPSDDPRLEPTGVAERLAGAIGRHVLAAGQASLRTIREIFAQIPVADGDAPRPPKIDPPASRPAASDRPAAGPEKTSPPTNRALSAPPPAELLRTDTALPESFASDRLVILARDPHCLYAYWDLSDAHGRKVRTQAGAGPLRLVLRTYDVTQVAFDATPPARFQDFAVAGEARSVYAYVGKPAACFVAEVGYLRADGAFFPLARSQPVWTPRTEQPGTAPGRWMTVGWSERADNGGVVPLATTGTGSLDAGASENLAAARRAPSSWPGPLPPATQRGSWSLVRGRPTTAASPDDPPATRNKP